MYMQLHEMHWSQILVCERQESLSLEKGGCRERERENVGDRACLCCLRNMTMDFALIAGHD